MSMNTISAERCAMMIGHPGHELRVFGWLQTTRPVVAVLTDGGGHDGASRLALTRELIETAGASVSPLFGLLSDQEMYQAILEQNGSLFLDLADRFADLLIRHEIECVAGDAIEGYNPTHDVCRLIIDRAVQLVRRRTGRSVRNFAFALVGAGEPSQLPIGARCTTLDPVQLAHKLAVSRRYGEAVGGGLLAELEQILHDFGEAALAREVLYPMNTAATLARFASETPFYEAHGAERVASGQYAEVIRFHKHFAPLAATLALQV